MTVLYITNGDSSCALLEEAGCEGTFLPWRDPLHEGPIIGATHGEIDAGRVAYLAMRFAVDPTEIRAEFADRNEIMRDHAKFDRIELWFEHDLYDQLQLVQALDQLAQLGRASDVTLVQADDFLGHQTPQTILNFLDRARPVTDADLATARGVWRALTTATPEAVFRMRDDPGLAALPFLSSSLMRFLQELPDSHGLSRTERTALEAAKSGPVGGRDLFRAAINSEEAAFMGDWSFFALVRDLASENAPLVSVTDDGETDIDETVDGLIASSFALTQAGADVLAGRTDRIALNGVDRWWAGTKLHGRTSWRYDNANDTLLPPDRDPAQD